MWLIRTCDFLKGASGPAHDSSVARLRRRDHRVFPSRLLLNLPPRVLPQPVRSGREQRGSSPGGSPPRETASAPARICCAARVADRAAPPCGRERTSVCARRSSLRPPHRAGGPDVSQLLVLETLELRRILETAAELFGAKYVLETHRFLETTTRPLPHAVTTPGSRRRSPRTLACSPTAISAHQWICWGTTLGGSLDG